MMNNAKYYCKSCGTQINWVKTESGKFMPLELSGVPHWANCPDAKKFKK